MMYQDAIQSVTIEDVIMEDAIMDHQHEEATHGTGAAMSNAGVERASKRIGIVAALPAELKPLTHGWEETEGVFHRHFGPANGGVECLAASAGMGNDAVTRAVAMVSASGPLTALVSIGWAGALSCGVKPPTAYSISEVVDSRTGERYPTADALLATVDMPALRLVTLDHVARADEKRKLAERYQAPLVDMEAATVARIARAQGIPFYCYKAISDAYTDVLPDFNLYLDEAGQLRLPNFIAAALIRPRYWQPLWRLGRNSKLAAQALAQHVPRCLQQAELVS